MEQRVKENFLSGDKYFSKETATAVKSNKIIKHLNPKKASGLDKILVKIIKTNGQ